MRPSFMSALSLISSTPATAACSAPPARVARDPRTDEFSVYLPPQARSSLVPALYFLSVTCAKGLSSSRTREVRGGTWADVDLA